MVWTVLQWDILIGKVVAKNEKDALKQLGIRVYSGTGLRGPTSKATGVKANSEKVLEAAGFLG